ncbi:hypothetical protein PQC07_gp101 [Aeromonas phage D3]|uniref:Uncharacterized protein n=2 Tax=Ludhianavirus TaxID=3044751 RepID=A0A7D6J412_9CAUD|nr:hypothetical protein PQC07_gp101 [Aeromonas phage D3]YP_010668921.1 hypothetical protein PQC08_gp102 [Aeromonas phage D6]QLM02909.1 hypothetical protein D3_0174 [Aeromonas phage D3]QNH80850.1 hypothetical protein D6_0173 [Aeromonas phage D6]
MYQQELMLTKEKQMKVTVTWNAPQSTPAGELALNLPKELREGVFIGRSPYHGACHSFKVSGEREAVEEWFKRLQVLSPMNTETIDRVIAEIAKRVAGALYEGHTAIRVNAAEIKVIEKPDFDTEFTSFLFETREQTAITF